MATLNLREVEKRLGKSTIAITVADMCEPDAPIVYANEAFLKVSGYGLPEIIGQNCRFLQDDSDNTAARQIIRDALAAGNQAQATLLNRKRDGAPFENLLFLEPLFDCAGTLAYFVGSQFPIASHTQPQDASRHANHLVREIDSMLRTNSELQAKTRASLAKNSAAAVRLWLDRT